jgi:D-sedoheptulose 7-phosphate isomerase
VRHVAVEFVHPVIVGKRALPALGIEPEAVELQADAADALIAFGSGPAVVGAVAAARRRGCLTIAFADVGTEWPFLAPTADPFVAQELHETLYHVVWELVHLFFEHRGLLGGGAHKAAASSFLYPFLGGPEPDLEAVLADVRASALAKAREVAGLRAQTLREGEAALRGAAAAIRSSLEAGGAVLALGNGGSATDAMDAVADLRFPPAARGWPARRALDLTADSAILTALANDIGPDVLFARQVIAYGRPGDVLLCFSTSGGSGNVLAALEQARRGGLASIAFVGYDGGRIAAEQLADWAIVTRSEHVPRIQEAQASAWHLLRELVEAGPEPLGPLQTQEET